MNIYLSVNNREEVLTLPVIPPGFTLQKPQGTETFETISKGDLMLIGEAKLKGISFESFFPVRDYPFLKNRDIWGWEYVDIIDRWIDEKLPIRLIITDTPINMAVAVKNFECSVKTDGDVWYKLEFEEFNLLEDEALVYIEEEIDMEELEKLKEEVKSLRETVDILANPMIYNYIDSNMPDWARETVQKLFDNGVIKGTGTDESGFPVLGLDYLTLRLLVVIDRALEAGAL